MNTFLWTFTLSNNAQWTLSDFLKTFQGSQGKAWVDRGAATPSCMQYKQSFHEISFLKLLFNIDTVYKYLFRFLLNMMQLNCLGTILKLYMTVAYEASLFA